MDPTVVLKLVREQRRQINDTFNTSQHKQITSTNSSSISNSISPNQIFQTPSLPSPVQISSNSQRNKLSNNYSLKLPLSSPSSNSSSFSSQSYFDKNDNNNSNNSNFQNNNNKTFNHTENYFQINNNLNQSCISPSSSQQIDSSVTRSGSVKSVASDSGVGSTSPLSDFSDYNNNNNSNNYNNNNPNNNSLNNKKNDVIVTHVSQQQKFIKSTLNGNTNNNQTSNNNINTSNNINNNILNNNTISSNGFSAFKQSSNIGSLPNQLYSNAKKPNNNIYDEYSNLIMQHKNSIQKSQNEANLIDQFNINTNLINSKQQNEMIYHMQNQQNLYQHHQPQPNQIINPNHHSQHNNLQQHQVQKSIYPSQICDKECCNHLNKKSFNLINSFSLETSNVNTANNPNIINKNNRPQNCDCKECNEMLLMNKKQPKTIPSPNIATSQYPPGYCDCPSCNIALAKMKSTQESKTNLPLLVAPTPIIPNIIPTNRFMISSNSSFSPIVQNSNLKNQYLQNQISLNNGHNNNNVNLHIKEGLVKSNMNYSNISNVNQDHTIKASLCSCPECLNINLKSQSNFYDNSYNNKDGAQLDVYNQKNSNIKKQNLIKPQMPNANQNKLILINNSLNNKHNNNININNKLKKSSSQVSLKNSVDNLTTAVLYANDYSDLADSHFIIKQKNLSYSEDANKINKQVNKRKLDSNLTDNEQVDKLSHSHSQEKRSLTINQMFHQMNENVSNSPYKVNQNISQIETQSFCNQKSQLDVNKLTSPLAISQNNLNTSKYGNDVKTDKDTSIVCLTNSNDDDIELGEVVSIDKIQNSSDIINKSNENSSKIADEQENFVRESDTPVTIPKKMFAFVSTRINDWLEKSVEFSYKLSLKTKIKMEKIFALLTKAWSKLLIINMIENNFDFYVTKDHSYNLNETETNMGTSSANSSSLPKEKDALELHDLLNNGHEFKFDTNEFDLLKEIALFNEGIDEEVFSNLCLNTQQNLKDKFNSSSGEREKFSKVLLFLKSIYSFKSHIIESLFCKNLNNSKNVYELINKKMNEILAEIENENIMPKNESIIENCLD